MAAVHSAVAGTSTVFGFTATISSNTTGYNVRAAAIAAGWNQVSPLAAHVTINSGVYVGATSTANPAFDTGASLPAGSQVELVNNGFILGAGGTGGNAAGTAPTAGGPALRAQAPLKVTNNGTIGGGGGGGGGGEGKGYQARDSYGAVTATYYSGGGGGGGGQGYPGGGGGAKYSGGYGGIRAATNGSAGTTTAVGGGGASEYGTNSPNTYMAGGYGGNGGSLGSAGAGGGGGGYGAEAGWPSGYTQFVWYSQQGGAAGGAAVVGNSNITWVTTGTRLGAIT